MRSNRPFKRPWWASLTVTTAGVGALWLALQPDADGLVWLPWFEATAVVLAKASLIMFGAWGLMWLWWDLIERFAFYTRVSIITIAEAYRKRYGQQQDQEEAP